MKTLPVDLLTQLKQESHTLTFLFKLDLTSNRSYYWTSFDQQIPYLSVWWEPKGIIFDQQNVSLLPKADSITLQVNNVDQKFSDFALANEIRGKQVTVYQAALDKNNQVISAVIVFLGYTDQIDINQKRATIEVYNHMIKWRKLTPRRNHFATCGWVFGDVAGEVTGTDALNYRCVISHVSSSSNRPITGSVSTQYWSTQGSHGTAWINATPYQDGTCGYYGLNISFISGGPYVPTTGKYIKSHLSSGGAYLIGIEETTFGTWAAGNMEGTLYFSSMVNSSFVDGEKMMVCASSGTTGLSTDAGTFYNPPTTVTWCDQSYDRCVILGNTTNFGGFRWLPGLATKNIIWGRK